MDELDRLVEATIRRYVQVDAHAVSVDALPMRPDERGYSGARLERHAVAFHAPGQQTETTTLITKEAPLVERRALDLLSSQHQCVPFSHTLDLTSDRPALVCQQDLGAAPSNSTEHPSPTATAAPSEGPVPEQLERERANSTPCMDHCWIN